MEINPGWKFTHFHITFPLLTKIQGVLHKQQLQHHSIFDTIPLMKSAWPQRHTLGDGNPLCPNAKPKMGWAWDATRQGWEALIELWCVFGDERACGTVKVTDARHGDTKVDIPFGKWRELSKKRQGRKGTADNGADKH